MCIEADVRFFITVMTLSSYIEALLDSGALGEYFDLVLFVWCVKSPALVWVMSGTTKHCIWCMIPHFGRLTPNGPDDRQAHWIANSFYSARNDVSEKMLPLWTKSSTGAVVLETQIDSLSLYLHRKAG